MIPRDNDYPGAIPPPPGVTPNLENPPDSGRKFNIIMLSVIDAIVILFFLLRLASNHVLHRRLILEDLICAIGVALLLFYSITCFLMIHYGLGYHQWDLSQRNVDQVLKWLYASSILFIPGAFAIKTTLLLLIARVYSVRRKVARGIHIFIGFIAIAVLPLQLCKIFLCSPINSYWRYDQPGKCLKQRKLFLADMSVSIFTDVVILIIPIPLTWALRTKWWRKAKIMLLLAGGGLAVGTTMYRLSRVVAFQTEVDVTSAFVDIDVLTITEMAIGAICACLPAVNILMSSLCSRRHKRRTHDGKGYVFNGRQVRDPNSTSKVLNFDTELAMWTDRGSADKINTSHQEGMVSQNGATRDGDSMDSGFGRREGWLASPPKARLESEGSVCDEPVDAASSDRNSPRNQV